MRPPRMEKTGLLQASLATSSPLTMMILCGTTPRRQTSSVSYSAAKFSPGPPCKKSNCAALMLSCILPFGTG